MFDLTLIKDLTEMIGKSLTFPDIETIGGYFFKNYSTHRLENLPEELTVSPLKASSRLVSECENQGKLKELFAFIIELDGNPINGHKARLIGLENLLYRLSRTGIYFDFDRRKFVQFDQDKRLMPNWGALKDNKEYPMIVASVDICGNSELVKKYKPSIMEKVYYKLWGFLNNKLRVYDGRIWHWAGDGGLIAFRDEKGPYDAVCCCLEILLSLPVFNSYPSKPIEEPIHMRIGMDSGLIRFFNDTGRIVSDVINYAAHLEKRATESNGLSISEDMYRELNPQTQEHFKRKIEFEGKSAYSLAYNFKDALN